MRTADIATVVVLMATGALVVSDSLRLGIGWGTDGPMSGFFPFWLAVLTIAAGAGIAVQALRRAGSGTFLMREQIAPVLKTLVPAIVAVLLMHVVGLYVACALYLAIYMRWIGGYRWWSGVTVAVVFAVTTFIVFERWFLVPMPKGPLEAWLGF